MWRIQAVSPFYRPLLWDEHCARSMFPSSLPAGQLKMWRLQDGAVLSQLIAVLTLNSSGEIQSCSVPWNLPLKLRQYLSLLVLHHSIFLLGRCWLADKLWPSQEKCSSWGITRLCGSVRNCQSRRIVPFPLGFCWSSRMFPLLLICCKVPPQHRRSPASIVSGFCTF